jgi:hypothetical protein
LISWPALGITIAIEAVVVFAFAWKLGLPTARVVLISVAANAITQPAFTIWLRHVLYGRDYLWWQYFAIGEACVWLAEASAYYWFVTSRGNPVRALLLSGFTNFCSLAVGLALPL